MKRILVIEDDNEINRLLSDILKDEVYDVTSAFSGTEGLLYLDNYDYDLILLDLMIPGKSGEEIICIIKKKSDIPIIIISAKEEIGIKAKLIRAGADDFITKPFDIDEVLARVHAVLRRNSNVRSVKKEFTTYKEILLDIDERVVRVGENTVNLTNTEFGILELLMSYPAKVFSKTNIFKSVWGDDFMSDDNTMTVHISNIRSKLKKAGAKEKYIKTVWSVGYKLENNS